MKKLTLMMTMVILISLSACVKSNQGNASAFRIDSITLSEENSALMVELDIDEDQLKIDKKDVLYYGIVYQENETSLEVDIDTVEVDHLLIPLEDIGMEDYSQNYYGKAYLIYQEDGEDKKILYAKDVSVFSVYDLALKEDSIFAKDIVYMIENEQVDSINLAIDMDEFLVLSTSSQYDYSFSREEDNIYITLEVEEGYYFQDNLEFYINDSLISASSYQVDMRTLSYMFDYEKPIDPYTYVDVNVHFDPASALWDSSVFSKLESEADITISSFNNDSKNLLSLGDSSMTSLQWFTKLFLQYNEQFQAYEIVYVDQAMYAVEDINNIEYDYFISVHDNCLDTDALAIISKYVNLGEEDVFLIFDSDLEHYVDGDISASFYSSLEMSAKYTTVMNEEISLPRVYKENYNFIGWSDGENIFTTFPRYQAKDHVSELYYTAVLESADLQEVYAFLDDLIPSRLESDLELEKSYGDYSITWQSSQPSTLSNDGVYDRPYQAKTMTLSATITKGDYQEIREYQLDVPAYKSLNGPIKSSYIYRDYSLVDDSFFQTLDIINCAFIEADSKGGLSEGSLIRNVNDYIMPKAKENGNWVLFSIAPESEWSDIASSDQLINDFADNIVEMINQYGFDGVDIDWETPTSAESERFTSMMRTVYQKVKDNNPNHLVTAAIAGGMWQPARYDLEDSSQYIDYINMMTYGMVNNGGYYQNALYDSSHYDNPSFQAGKTLISCSIEESIAIYNGYGIPNDKIIVGVAFYGIKQTRSYNSDTQSWSDWARKGSLHFTNIYNNYINNADYTVYYDNNSDVPYIIKNDGTEFISYDDARSIASKSAYIIENGLGGIMYWENGLDHSGTLLDAIEEGFKE